MQRTDRSPVALGNVEGDVNVRLSVYHLRSDFDLLKSIVLVEILQVRDAGPKQLLAEHAMRDQAFFLECNLVQQVTAFEVMIPSKRNFAN